MINSLLWLILANKEKDILLKLNCLTDMDWSVSEMSNTSTLICLKTKGSIPDSLYLLFSVSEQKVQSLEWWNTYICQKQLWIKGRNGKDITADTKIKALKRIKKKQDMTWTCQVLHRTSRSLHAAWKTSVEFSVLCKMGTKDCRCRFFRQCITHKENPLHKNLQSERIIKPERKCHNLASAGQFSISLLSYRWERER